MPIEAVVEATQLFANLVLLSFLSFTHTHVISNLSLTARPLLREPVPHLI
jgi:hypothetical protein